MEKLVRDCECSRCNHSWAAEIERSKATPNISGEATICCPLCGKRATFCGAARGMTPQGSARVLVTLPGGNKVSISWVDFRFLMERWIKNESLLDASLALAKGESFNMETIVGDYLLEPE